MSVPDPATTDWVQIGAPRSNVGASKVAAAETISSTTYVQPPTRGPEVGILEPGLYLVMLGATVLNAGPPYMSFLGPGMDADDANAARATGTANAQSMFFATLVWVPEPGALLARYRVGASPSTFSDRWMIAIRAG